MIVVCTEDAGLGFLLFQSLLAFSKAMQAFDFIA